MAEASVATDRSRAVCRRRGSAWIQFMESCAQDHGGDTAICKEHCPGQGRWAAERNDL